MLWVDSIRPSNKTPRMCQAPVRFVRALIPLCFALGIAANAHNVLLPQPQEIHYGDGNVHVGKLSIHYGPQRNAEDEFAGAELTKRLREITKGASKSAGSLTVTLDRTGMASAIPTNNEVVGPNSREAYSLEVNRNGVKINASSSAGIYYGVQTLLQLVEGTGNDAMLPMVQIHDWPTLPYRGMMGDFSEGELLRVSEVERQLDTLAQFKANQYYFYSEASIEFEGYEMVNAVGRYSQADVRHVIDYARQRHIDVVPCMELYGHMHNLFRYEKFADLGLPRYGGEFDPRNPQMYAVLDNWIEQTAKLFPSPFYHVGFDEPWSLGKIGVVPGKDPFKTFMDVLRHISEKAQSLDKRVLFWADINEGASTLSQHPELINDIPNGVIACPWVYDPHTNYSPWVEPLAKVNATTMVAPGVWAWNEIFPDFHKSFFNINELIATGRKFHTIGVINTTWTDSRQTIYRLQLPGIAFGAVASWQPERVDTNTFFGAYCSYTYPPAAAAHVTQALEELSTVEEIIERVLGNTSQAAFWADPLVPGQLKKIQSGEKQLRRLRLLAESAQEHLQLAMRTSSDPTLHSYLVSARMCDYLGMKCLYALEWSEYFRQLKENPTKELVSLYIGNQMNSTTYGMIGDLQEFLSELRGQYRDVWLEEATPFRLQSALYRWDNEWQYWNNLRTLVIEKVLHSWKPGEPFPSIEVIHPKHGKE
jgi:hexosaminidase